MTKENKNKTNFFYHLEELRWIIVKIILFLLAMSVTSYIFKDYIFDAITNPLIGLDVTIIHLKVYEKFMAYIKLSIYSGLILSFPIIIYQISKFIMPALYKHEKKWYLIGMFFVIVLFFSGSILSYRVLAPISINFLLSFGRDEDKNKENNKESIYELNRRSIEALSKKLSLSEQNIENTINNQLPKNINGKQNKEKENKTEILANELINIIDIQRNYNKVFLSLNDNLNKLVAISQKSSSEKIASYLSIGEYIDWIVVFIFMVGVVFQLPIVVSLLAKIGIVNDRTLGKFRPYSLILILVVAAIITPPDWVSQIIVAMPVYALYEISIILAMIIRKKEERKEAEEAEKAKIED